MNLLDQIEYEEDEVFGRRLLISIRADQSELVDNIRAARSILASFPDVYMVIRGHSYTFEVKNPEYIIDDLTGDRKGIESENGIKSAFRKAIKQGCRAIVLDLDKHLSFYSLKSHKLTNGLYGRRADFLEKIITDCYVVYQDKAVRITSADFTSFDDKDALKRHIEAIIEKLRT